MELGSQLPRNWVSAWNNKKKDIGIDSLKNPAQYFMSFLLLDTRTFPHRLYNFSQTPNIKSSSNPNPFLKLFLNQIAIPVGCFLLLWMWWPSGFTLMNVSFSTSLCSSIRKLLIQIKRVPHPSESRNFLNHNGISSIVQKHSEKLSELENFNSLGLLIGI